MKKREFKKKYGLSDENFLFYVDMGMVKKVGRDKYEAKEGFDSKILEKSTVFKYYFEDAFGNDMREFANFVKYTGKVKRFTPEEIKEFEKKRKEEEAKNEGK